MLKGKEKNSDKKSDKKYAKVCGCDEYGREAWLMVENDKNQERLVFCLQRKVVLLYIHRNK